MPGVVGQQEFWVAGSRAYLQREGDVYDTLYDLGNIEPVSPETSPEEIELEDSDGGIKTTADKALIKQNETLTIRCRNFTLDNLALFYLAATPQEFTQATDVILAVPHIAVKGAGQMIKLHGPAPAKTWLFNIADIVVKSNDGVTTYVENTDYKWVSKDRGLIQILSGSVIAHGAVLKIDITPNALSGKRLVLPQTGGASIKGKMMLVWGINNNQHQVVREANVILTPGAGSITVDQYSSIEFKAAVVSDITQTQQPAGRLLKIKGALPTGPAA